MIGSILNAIRRKATTEERMLIESMCANLCIAC